VEEAEATVATDVMVAEMRAVMVEETVDAMPEMVIVMEAAIPVAVAETLVATLVALLPCLSATCPTA
jgi:hypothetical protein